jgi:hypothetical protein
MFFCFFIVFSAEAICTLALATESGFNEIESIPHATKNSANSGWSEGACPQIPTLQPHS